MSAFLVGNRVINKIVKEVSESEYFKEKLEEEFLIDLSNAEWQTQLGQKMLDINQAALSCRYGDPKRDLTYTFQPVYCTKIEAIKALQCWLYQCAEGDIPQKEELYIFFDNYVISRWTMDVVQATTEYEEAEWG